MCGERGGEGGGCWRCGKERCVKEDVRECV